MDEAELGKSFEDTKKKMLLREDCVVRKRDPTSTLCPDQI